MEKFRIFRMNNTKHQQMINLSIFYVLRKNRRIPAQSRQIPPDILTSLLFPFQIQPVFQRLFFSGKVADCPGEAFHAADFDILFAMFVHKLHDILKRRPGFAAPEYTEQNTDQKIGDQFNDHLSPKGINTLIINLTVSQKPICQLTDSRWIDKIQIAFAIQRNLSIDFWIFHLKDSLFDVLASINKRSIPIH